MFEKTTEVLFKFPYICFKLIKLVSSHIGETCPEDVRGQARLEGFVLTT